MTAELVVWIVSLASVFLVGWAWGRSGRRVVVMAPKEIQTVLLDGTIPCPNCNPAAEEASA